MLFYNSERGMQGERRSPFRALGQLIPAARSAEVDPSHDGTPMDQNSISSFRASLRSAVMGPVEEGYTFVRLAGFLGSARYDPRSSKKASGRSSLKTSFAPWKVTLQARGIIAITDTSCKKW
jgi:hypothetical protein